jgi:hypothetical protein
MFCKASSFNQNIGSWNVFRVANLQEMFCGATKFDQDIDAWNVSCVTDMKKSSVRYRSSTKILDHGMYSVWQTWKKMLFWLKNDASSNMCDISGTLDTQDLMSWLKDDALLNMDFMVITLDSGYIPRSNGHIECIHSLEQNTICPGLAQHSIYQLGIHTYMHSTPYMHRSLKYPSIASRVHRNVNQVIIPDDNMCNKKRKRRHYYLCSIDTISFFGHPFMD